jgi:1,4-alpha-glucan branching enzyme
VAFRVEAPEASEVFLAGTFNNWNPEAIRLRHDGDGFHVASVSLAPGRYEYKLVIDGVWQIDEGCPEWTANSYGSLNSVIEVA